MVVLTIYSANQVFVSLEIDGGLLMEPIIVELFTGEKKVKSLEVIMPAVEKLLEKAKLTVKDITHIAVSSGVGSFTSLRVGLITAKTLALMTGAKLISFTTFDLLEEKNSLSKKEYLAALAYAGGYYVKNKKGEVRLYKQDEISEIRDKTLFEEQLFIIKATWDVVAGKIAKKEFVSPIELDAYYVENSRAEDELEAKNKKK